MWKECELQFKYQGLPFDNLYDQYYFNSLISVNFKLPNFGVIFLGTVKYLHTGNYNVIQLQSLINVSDHNNHDHIYI